MVPNGQETMMQNSQFVKRMHESLIRASVICTDKVERYVRRRRGSADAVEQKIFNEED